MNKYVRFIFDSLPELILSIPKTIYFNFRVLPFLSAIRMPFVVSYHIKLRGISKKSFVVKNKNMGFASVRVGFGSSLAGHGDRKRGLVCARNGGKIILEGSGGFSRGVIIDSDGGTIVFGKHFRCNFSSTISCSNSSIVFGDEVVLGWRVTVKNGDGHFIIEDGETRPNHGPISIGNHVWLCSECDVLKGVTIGNDCVVAYRSLVTKSETGDNLMYAGTPAKVIKTNINWVE